MQWVDGAQRGFSWSDWSRRLNANCPKGRESWVEGRVAGGGSSSNGNGNGNWTRMIHNSCQGQPAAQPTQRNAHDAQTAFHRCTVGASSCLGHVERRQCIKNNLPYQPTRPATHQNCSIKLNCSPALSASSACQSLPPTRYVVSHRPLHPPPTLYCSALLCSTRASSPVSTTAILRPVHSPAAP